VVAELVVDGDQVLLRRLDAHLDAQIVVHGHVPGAGVAHHLAVLGLGQHRALPEGPGQRVEAERGAELLPDLDHLYRTDLAGGHGAPVSGKPMSRAPSLARVTYRA